MKNLSPYPSPARRGEYELNSLFCLYRQKNLSPNPSPARRGEYEYFSPLPLQGRGVGGVRFLLFLNQGVKIENDRFL